MFVAKDNTFLLFATDFGQRVAIKRGSTIVLKRRGGGSYREEQLYCGWWSKTFGWYLIDSLYSIRLHFCRLMSAFYKSASSNKR